MQVKQIFRIVISIVVMFLTVTVTAQDKAIKEEAKPAQEKIVEPVQEKLVITETDIVEKKKCSASFTKPCCSSKKDLEVKKECSKKKKECSKKKKECSKKKGKKKNCKKEYKKSCCKKE